MKVVLGAVAHPVVRITLLILSISSVVWGQGSTAQINGSVSDASGAAVPGAQVKVTQTATGLVRTVNSGADGGYVIPNLPVGPYMLEVVKDGFTKYVQMGIVLQVDSNPTIAIPLKVGALSDQVTVEAGATQVETHSTSIGQVVSNQQIAEMPLNGRNPIELVFLAGMASFPGNGAINSVRNYPTVVVSVAGGQGNGVAICSTAPCIRILTTIWRFRCPSRTRSRNSRWKPAPCPRSTDIMPPP